MDLKGAMGKKKAVALQYRTEMGAPQILAKGEGTWAEKILQVARTNGIPIVEHAEVIPLLFQQEVGSLIPESSYEVIAQILAFVYTLEQKRQRNESYKS
ncbi:MAG: EscU/YscU/HrcU family type III secretion system export apparatus switch protein [Spirochaetes bacterium]|nr:EscU/YscU/HrcU family type III secretion system export apparatus switch protein [Spirochaetota bacterium]